MQEPNKIVEDGSTITSGRL